MNSEFFNPKPINCNQNKLISLKYIRVLRNLVLNDPAVYFPWFPAQKQTV